MIFTQVIKRDGAVVEFDRNKIVNAIKKAMIRTDKGIDKETAEIVADKIENKLVKEKKFCNIEMIQNKVEYNLMLSNRKDVAQEYIRYRFKRIEEKNSINNIDREIQGLFDMTSEEVVNNANKAGDKFHTYRAMIADIACKDYAKRRIVPQKFNDAHEEGSIYIHDYNYIAIPFFNCILIDWIDMLKNGFEVGSTKISTPKGVTTAIALLSQIVAHVSSNCYGGVTLPSLCTGLEPYVRSSYEKHFAVGLEWLEDEDRAKKYAWQRLEKEVYDAAQAFEYEIQTLTNSRGEMLAL
ncbi:anaerobic ribonucleoside-triphosphate reductase [Paenibacillus sp. NRS-1775]|uniref:anaerobic ribonucleoside-triphosphate reductase n=1 Tax=unclassified Paenibacillus TaxID=185978 RepID=UPI003D2AAA46